MASSKRRVFPGGACYISRARKTAPRECTSRQSEDDEEEKELVFLKERKEEQRHKLRDMGSISRKRMSESTRERVHAESRGEQRAVRDPFAPHELVPRKGNPALKHKVAIDVHMQIQVISMGCMHMNETLDDTNNPTLVIHDSCSECVWAVPARRKATAHTEERSGRHHQVNPVFGDRDQVKSNKPANGAVERQVVETYSRMTVSFVDIRP